MKIGYLFVIPAKAGMTENIFINSLFSSQLDSRFHGNDKVMSYSEITLRTSSIVVKPLTALTIPSSTIESIPSFFA